MTPIRRREARAAAAARLARGVRNLARAETQRDVFNSDPVDIAKSAGIGLLNGMVNAAGLPGDMLTGFGYFPNNFVPDLFRSMDGRPQIPPINPTIGNRGIPTVGGVRQKITLANFINP